MSDVALPRTLAVPARCFCFRSGIETQAGHRYNLSVSGKWVDFCDPPVSASGRTLPGGIRDHIGWSKRLPDAPWMALLVRTEGQSGTSRWQALRDGDNIIDGLPAGELQLCANDTPGFYWNNSGQLSVTVADITAVR